ncbi:hypothetical protein E2C01_029652 [Portunus trituberculatus]|uniref:Uncharacterized protein n=1 Tax=Portunus trituberculatus TaxID=210409 RepID=A0A5B7ETI2_PORTR|nr:hypothetical protein [Portunus trituberculatus]
MVCNYWHKQNSQNFFLLFQDERLLGKVRKTKQYFKHSDVVKLQCFSLLEELGVDTQMDEGCNKHFIDTLKSESGAPIDETLPSSTI